MSNSLTTFGGNIRFTPRHVYAPTTEAEVLEILDRHAQGKIRVVGAMHSWSPVVVCEDAVVDLRHFDSVEIQSDADGNTWAHVGAGCRIKHLLQKLHALGDVTMPSLGLITEQAIAGAISTATHGSGRHSLSHYVDELRVAAYDPATGKACIYTWNQGPELLAARCALGCMGVILRVRFRCVPKYEVAETIVACADLDDALAGEGEFPLQQVYLVPHLWAYFAQRRCVTPEFRSRRSLSAKLYRAWWFCNIDVGLHLVIKTLVSILRSPALTRFFFRHVLAKLILKNVTVTDHSDKMLVMEHELFRHLEIEIFVPARHVRAAADFVQAVVQVFDGATPAEQSLARLVTIGMTEELEANRGTFTHHYPITFRRVLPDETMISMTGGNAPSPPTPLPGGEGSSEEPWYAISLITYVEPRDRFFAMASFLARSMARLFEARLHWGKYFPLEHADVAARYPRLADFNVSCRRVDPHGVFRNSFIERIVGSS